jgi:hypothetical protein
MNYQYVDLPYLDVIAKKVLEKIPDEVKTSTTVAPQDCDMFKDIPELVQAVELFKSWDELYNICIGYTLPNYRQVIHIDSYTHSIGMDSTTSKYALNIPIFNCDNSYTCWYKHKDPLNPKVIEWHHAGSTTYVYPFDDMIECDRVYWTKPLWFNILEPHCGFNYTDKERIMISVRFKTKFDWEL